MKYQIEMIGGMKAEANSLVEVKEKYRKAFALGLGIIGIKRVYKNGLVLDMLPYVKLTV